MIVAPLSLSSVGVEDGREVRVRPGQVVVHRALEPGAGARLRRVADDVRRRARAAGSRGSRASGRPPSAAGSSRSMTCRRPRRSCPRLIVNCATRWIALSCRSARSPRRPRLPVRRRDDERGEQRRARRRASREICLFTRALRLRVRAVRDEQQPREQDEVRDDARAAVADERQRDPGQRDQPQDAADDDERLQREAEREAGGEQLREAVLGEQRDAEAARDEEHVDEQQRGGADEPELLRERRVDEVGVEVRDDRVAARRS